MRDRLHQTIDAGHLLLAGIVVLAVAVRAYGLGAESLWVDELFTREVLLERSYREIVLELPREDPHPTLYYVLLKGWTAVAGVSAQGMRSFSVAVGAAAVPMAFLTGRRLWDRDAGLVAALLFALSPFYVWYGRDARMYALLTLFGLVLLYCLVDLVERRSRGGEVGVVLAGIAVCLTHAMGVLTILAANVYAFGHALSTRGRVGALSIRRWVALQLVTVVACAPYWYVLLYGTFVDGRFEGNVEWIPPVTPATPWRIFGTYVGRTIPPTSPWDRRSLWTVGPVDLSVLGELGTLAALGCLVLALVPLARRRSDPDGVVPEFLALAWLLVPILVLAVLSVGVTPTLFDRYTAAAGIGALLLIARGMALLATTRRRAFVAVALVVLLLGVPTYGILADPQKPQWEATAGTIDESADDESLVLVSPGSKIWIYDHYSTRSDLEVRALGRGAGANEVRDRTDDEDVVWLVVTAQSDRDRERLLAGVEAAGYERDRHEDVTEIDVYRFARNETGRHRVVRPGVAPPVERAT